MALPFLVRILDIPLSKLDAYRYLFDRHPELDKHVRFVRIIDDKAANGFVHRLHSQPRAETDSPTETANASNEGSSTDSKDRWLQLKDMIKDRWPHARYDLTAGVSSVDGVAALSEQEEITKNIVSVRWIADHPKRPRGGTFDHQLVQDQRAVDESRWLTAAKVTHIIILTQTVSDVKLVALRVSEHQPENIDEQVRIGAFWTAFGEFPQTHIRNLSVSRSIWLDLDVDERVIFEHGLTSLTWLTIDCEISPGNGEDALMGDVDIDAWLSNHPSLVRLDIGTWRDMPLLSREHELPDLRSINFKGWEPGQVGSFLLRHRYKLTELELPKFVSGGGLLAAVTPGLVLPNLRILRARPRTAAALVEGRNAPCLSCIEFSPVQTQSELMLDEWILPHSEATRHITCLDIELDQEEVLDAVNELHGVFNAERFPSLVELSLCSTGTLEDDDHCATGNQHLRLTLERLRLLPSLRALRIEAMHLQPFPVQGPQVLDRAEAPPNLEYLTWHAPTFNCTQYFRAVRVPHERTLRRPRDVLKMQRLPASFRAHISEDGEWVQPGRLRQTNILFDHTVSPPILPPQA